MYVRQNDQHHFALVVAPDWLFGLEQAPAPEKQPLASVLNSFPFVRNSSLVLRNSQRKNAMFLNNLSVSQEQRAPKHALSRPS